MIKTQNFAHFKQKQPLLTILANNGMIFSPQSNWPTKVLPLDLDETSRLFNLYSLYWKPYPVKIKSLSRIQPLRKLFPVKWKLFQPELLKNQRQTLLIFASCLKKSQLNSPLSTVQTTRKRLKNYLLTEWFFFVFFQPIRELRSLWWTARRLWLLHIL